MDSMTQNRRVVKTRMSTSRRSQKQGLDALLKAATDLHGHFGPFLTLGVRMGIVGLRELGAKEGDTQLHITGMLKYAVPISCMLDGIQTSTKCTVGNKRLEWKESNELGAMFLLKNSTRRVEVKVNPTLVQELKRKLDKMPHSGEEVRQLASEVASRPEKELFSIIHK